MNKTFSVLIFVVFTFIACPQQRDTIIISGSEYQAGGLHRTMFGDLWRDVWATPIKIPVLDLKTFAGGLVPEKRGGGMQTKTLHFKGADGQTWKFRSLNKFPKPTLPDDIKNTLVADFIQDQISTSHPAAAVVLTPFMDSLGILNAPPTLWFLPDDPILGEFREEFKNLAGMMEVNPDENEEGGTPFANAEKIISTEKLVYRFLDKRDEKVDAAAFLTARLFDVFVGDWDRHMGQWKWAKYTVNGKELWKPIPKDRDRAFSKFDGLTPWVSTLIIPQWKDFDYDYPPAEFATWSGRYLDRRFLSELTRNQWDSVTTFVISKLTDDLIDSSLSRFPEEHKPLSVTEIKEKLISRRGKLLAFSDEYYRHINKIVDIYASDKDDHVDIQRTDTSTIITLSGKKKKGSDLREVLYQKEFDSEIASDIRIHLSGGDDQVKITGTVESGPLIRIDGGEGKDQFIDSSHVKGWFLNFLPIRRAENKNRFFDNDASTSVTYGRGTKFRVEESVDATEPQQYIEPTWLQEGRGYGINPVFDLSSTTGLQLGGGPIIINYDYRKKPWDSWLTLTAAYATRPRDFDFVFESYFNSILDDATVSFRAYRINIEFNNYYGHGNNTDYNNELFESEFYRIKRRVTSGEMGVDLHIGDGIRNYYQARLSFYEVSVPEASLLKGLPNGSYGDGDLSVLTLGTGFIFDKRDNIDLPLEGWYLKFGGNYNPKLFNTKESFYNATFDLRAYIPISFLKNSALAFRVGGEKVGGEYPFFAAAFLGGSKNLRAYRNERFSGDASLFGTTEIRVELGSIKTIIYSRVGVFAFVETGRVFKNGENSDIWHLSSGGGVYLSFLDRALILATTVGFSSEYTNYHFTTKVLF